MSGTENSKKKKHIRRRAHNRSWRILKNCKCFWCSVDLVDVRQIRKSHRLRLTANSLRYMSEGKIITRLIATIDHILPLSKGGDNSPVNLVPCCPPCNRKRGNRLLSK